MARFSHRQRMLLLSSYYIATTGFGEAGVGVNAETFAHSCRSASTSHHQPCRDTQQQQQQQQEQHRAQSSRHHHHPPFWGISSLPSLPKQGKTFLDECESLVAILERVRGGSDYYGGGSDPSQYNDDDDYYGNDDYYYGEDQRGAGGYDGDDYHDYYDDRGRNNQQSSKRRNGGSTPAFVDNLPGIFKNGDRRIGLPVTAAGTVITMLGISLFFNKTLMRLGNLLFIAGITITMGISRTMTFFFKPEKMRATACLGLGIFLVFIGSPVFGMILEVFGLLNLFGNMFPVLLAIAKTMPGIGPLLSNKNKSKNQNSGGGSRRRNDDFYYDDDRYDEGRGGRDGYYDDDRYNDNYDDGRGYGSGRDNDSYY